MDTKPPLGVTPRVIISEDRIESLRDAIIRYTDAGLTPLLEWYEEISELENWIKSCISKTP